MRAFIGLTLLAAGCGAPELASKEHRGIGFTDVDGVYLPGAMVPLTLTNPHDVEVVLDHCGLRLQHLLGDQWITLPQPEPQVCHLVLMTLQPFAEISLRVGVPKIDPGQYRWVTTVASEAFGTSVVATAPFVVVEG